jgi:uncharacterized protein
MLIYSATKDEFCEDVRLNRIEERVLTLFKEKLHRSTSESEIASWRNSLTYMATILDLAATPPNAGVAVEYTIPQSGKRVDFILSGYAEDGSRNLIITELKQWQEVGITEKDAVVETRLAGAWRETTHPSYQAWSYAQLLMDFNEAIELGNIKLWPCAYLHNCNDESVVRHPNYSNYTTKAPIFLRQEPKNIGAFFQNLIHSGDDGKLLGEIEKGRIRPAKELAVHLESLLKGNPEFTMIDDQKLVYEQVMELSKNVSPDKKNVLIVRGGPGTGKTVVAVNLLVELIKAEKTASYVTSNSAPRDVYESRLSGVMRKSRISMLFRNSGSFINSETGEYDVLLADEAHRLREKSGFVDHLGENQIKEIINAANLSVFFLDEDQRVTLRDIGSHEEIYRHAKNADAEVFEAELASQFRCNGSDGYLSWVDNTLQVKPTANPSLDGIDYDFRVCSSPNELRSLINENNRNNKSRLVAGYCWKWISKKDSSKMDIAFPEHDFEMQWNLNDDGMLWLIKDNSVDQIGCIHTCQGLELEYVGVIIGPDLIVRDGKIQTDATKRAIHDKSVKGYKTMLKEDPQTAAQLGDLVIKNTYRVLMSRGQRGCFIWSDDEETNEWFRHCGSN